jgi:hypothetical protein
MIEEQTTVQNKIFRDCTTDEFFKMTITTSAPISWLKMNFPGQCLTCLDADRCKDCIITFQRQPVIINREALCQIRERYQKK